MIFYITISSGEMVTSMEHNRKQDLEYCKKPLSIGITVRCIVFILALCVSLGVIIYFSYRNTFYKNYERYITDILRHVDRHIDDDDLSECVDTLTESEKYKELRLFMDDIMNGFNVHYLYILKPTIDEDGSRHFISVISAEDYHNRYEDTEGNLYLGWTSDGEYSDAEIDRLLDILKQDKMVFYKDVSEWGVDYTGALPLKNGKGVNYAILAVDVDISSISAAIRKNTIEIEGTIVVLGLIFTIMFLYWARISVTMPIHNLEKGVVNFINKIHHNNDINSVEFHVPEIHTENEVESLSRAMTEMSDDMRRYILEIIEVEKKADMMASMAMKDTLTGIRNKTAYDKEVDKMNASLDSGELKEFGFAMIDLNFLKKINDTYGHEKGNISIKKLSMLVCDVFKHSPVFRIGGDEFIAILKGNDYEHRLELIEEFKRRLDELANDTTLKPWDRISAAIGVAVYEDSAEKTVVSVFKAADANMYQNKKEMKAGRE